MMRAANTSTRANLLRSLRKSVPRFVLNFLLMEIVIGREPVMRNKSRNSTKTSQTACSAESEEPTMTSLTLTMVEKQDN